jgi:hypothetical protein
MEKAGQFMDGGFSGLINDIKNVLHNEQVKNFFRNFMKREPDKHPPLTEKNQVPICFNHENSGCCTESNSADLSVYLLLFVIIAIVIKVC